MARSFINRVRDAMAELLLRPDKRHISPSALREFWIETLLQEVDPDARYTPSLLGDGRTDYDAYWDKIGIRAVRELKWLHTSSDKDLLNFLWSHAAEVL